MQDTSRNVKRILIVEDEIPIVELCRRVLTDCGFEVDTVSSVKAAYETIERIKYDIYLIDMRLPQIDGTELYLWLEAKRPELLKKVIFTTGDVMNRDTLDFLKKNKAPLLEKPFSPDELKSIIQQVMNPSRDKV